MRIGTTAALAAATWLVAGAAVAQQPAATPIPPPADWGQALREDAQAFHDLIAENHPGPVDRENPGFSGALEDGLRLALRRADAADSYADWYFALEEYASSFDDGHLTLYGHAPMGHQWRMRWPGFLTGLKGEGEDRHEVVFNQDPAAPPVGAVLVSCDGRDAEALASEILGRGAGRWSLRSRRASYAGGLFVDQTNPYVRRPEKCLFRVGEEVRDYRLGWRDLPDATRDEGFALARSPRFFAPIALRTWDRGYWVELGGFDGDPDSEDGKRLTPLVAEIEARAAALRQADTVVFDLRGNNGGSSNWINLIAKALWGEAYVEAFGPSSDGVDWRVSPGNLAAIKRYQTQLTDPTVLEWLREIDAGLTAAAAAGEPLWFQANEDEADAPTAQTAGPNLMQGRVYVLTDYGCASACLDAVDLLKALGAVQVGQETSADTLYMEIRGGALPSGRARYGVPMKVYRGRARGSNETAVPTHGWTGALADTAGIEAWLAEIDAGR